MDFVRGFFRSEVEVTEAEAQHLFNLLHEQANSTSQHNLRRLIKAALVDYRRNSFSRRTLIFEEGREDSREINSELLEDEEFIDETIDSGDSIPSIDNFDTPSPAPCRIESPNCMAQVITITEFFTLSNQLIHDMIGDQSISEFESFRLGVGGLFEMLPDVDAIRRTALRFVVVNYLRKHLRSRINLETLDDFHG